jgi:hypothetical protein
MLAFLLPSEEEEYQTLQRKKFSFFKKKIKRVFSLHIYSIFFLQKSRIPNAFCTKRTMYI